jgi:hypothetical protein
MDSDAGAPAISRQAFVVRASTSMVPAASMEAQYAASQAGATGGGFRATIRPHPSRTGRFCNFAS